MNYRYTDLMIFRKVPLGFMKNLKIEQKGPPQSKNAILGLANPGPHPDAGKIYVKTWYERKMIIHFEAMTACLRRRNLRKLVKNLKVLSGERKIEIKSGL